MTEKSTDRIYELFAQGTAIDRALRRAVHQALLRHRQAGFPVAEWRDGKIIWIPPEQIRLPEACNEGNENAELPNLGHIDLSAYPQ